MDQPRRREPLEVAYVQLAEAIKILQEARDVVDGDTSQEKTEDTTSVAADDRDGR